MNDLTVLNLGGSMFNPGEINVPLILHFRTLILSKLDEGQRFLVVTGGGVITRQYQAKAKEAGIDSVDALDEIGLMPTRLNAVWMKHAFGEKAHDEILTDFEANIPDTAPVIMAGGVVPGWSTDYVTVRWAHVIGAKRALIMGSAPYVYDKDFNKFDDAVKFESMTWDQYLEISGTERTPGMHAPVDPVAAQFAKEHGIEAIVIGPDINNLEKVLNSESFEGTVIS